jgi:importin subunit alpha-1
MLSVEHEPPINEILQMGVVPRLVHYLKFHEQYPTLTLEAAWALTNIVIRRKREN